MRVDKDDRYMPEQSSKSSTPSFSISTFFQHYSKKKLIIMGLALAIIVLLVCFVISRPSKKTTILTPPEVNSSTQTPDPTISSDNGALAQGQSSAPMPPAPFNSNVNEHDTGVSQPPASTQPTSSSRPDLQPTDNSTTQNNSGSSTTLNKPINPDRGNPTVSNSNNSVITGNNSNSIAKIKNDQFSIQLSSSSSVDGLKKLVKEHNVTNYQIYETKRNNVKWYILVKGTYDSADEARKAIKSLPSALQKDKPWIKSGETINKEKSAK